MKNRKKSIVKTNAVLYLRVSSEEQVKNLSLATQQQRTVAHCAQMGWPVVEVFRDEGRSAKTTQRGAQLIAAGVLLRSVSETIDETSTGTLMTNIFAAMNQFDNDRKAERTKTGMLKAASIGRWPHKAPLGYRNVVGARVGPNIVPDPDSSALVKKAFELAATGLHSKADILRTITQLGPRTAKGKPLSAQTFQKTLVNPIYKGMIVLPEWDFSGPGSFQPLIDADLFDQVQDVLNGRRPSLTGYQRNRIEFPLRVFVRCAKCGVGITGSISKGRNDTYAYYACREKSCYSFRTAPDELHSIFLAWLTRLAPKPEAIEAIKETIRAVWQQRKGDMDALRSVLSRKLTKAEERKATLLNRLLDGDVDKVTYKTHSARLTVEIEDVKAEIRNTELEDIELERVLEFADRIILRPARLWVESSLDQRQRLQKTLFPNGIEFDGEEFGTDSTPIFFRLLERDSAEDNGVWRPRRDLNPCYRRESRP
jgi:DNA invertase Pin-like site-specific DNA recombinase